MQLTFAREYDIINYGRSIRDAYASTEILNGLRKELAMAWLWIGVIIAAVIVEAFTDQLVSIWFVPAAIVAAIMHFCAAPEYWQLIVFFLIALVGIVFAKVFLPKFMPKTTDTRTNIDAIIGERCVVTEKIDNYAGCGQARVKGQIWSARGVGEDDVFEVGEVLNIVAIEGVKLICKKTK